MIYILYKAKYYKSSRGYIYRANQSLSIIVSFIVSLVTIMIDKWNVSEKKAFILFTSIAFLLFFLLEKNVNKKKLLKHRKIYTSRKKYLIPFFVVSIVLVAALLITYYFKKQKPTQSPPPSTEFVLTQDRSSLSINQTDTSISKSQQLELAIPPSTISSLSSGEFVGMVADNPDQQIELKTFHCRILNNHATLKREEENYKDIPGVREINSSIIQRNYSQIKQDIEDLVNAEIDRVNTEPLLQHLIIRK